MAFWMGKVMEPLTKHEKPCAQKYHRWHFLGSPSIKAGGGGGDPPSATWEPNCASFACRGSGCFLHPVQEARSNCCLDQHFVPHDVTSCKMLFIDFQARWYIVQCHIVQIVQIDIFCEQCLYVMQSINPRKSWWVVVRQMSWPVAECPIHGRREPAPTNAPVVDETVLAFLGWTQTILHITNQTLTSDLFFLFTGSPIAEMSKFSRLFLFCFGSFFSFFFLLLHFHHQLLLIHFYWSFFFVIFFPFVTAIFIFLFFSLLFMY